MSLAKQLSGYRSSLSESSDNHCTETAPKKRKPLNIQPQRNEADRAMDTSTVNSNASQDLDAHQGGDRTSSSLNGVSESTNVMSTSTTARNKDITEIMAGPTDPEGIVTLANTSKDLDAHQGGDRTSSSLNGFTKSTNVMSTSTTARNKDNTEIMAGHTDPEGIVTLANTSKDLDAHQGGDRTSSSLNGVSESTNVMSTSTTARNKDNTEIMAGPTDPEGIVTLANTSIPASPCSDAVVNPETQDRSNGVQGHIFADGSPASVSSCNDSAVVSNRPEVMQGEVTSTPLSSYLHEQNAETLPGDDVFPSSDEDGELMEWEPAGCENSGANSPVTCEPELENVFEGTTSNICASQESSEVGNGSSYQGSSSEQGNTTSSPMRINAEIVSTVLSAVCVNNLHEQVETRRTKRSMNKEGKGRSSIISERNNADASSSASEETISVLQPEPPIVGLETFCNNGDSGKTGNAVRSSDFPGMDDVLQVIIAGEENERGSFQCETSAHPEGVNGEELYVNIRSTDDAGGGRERYPETQMMRPSRTDLNVPHGSVPHWSQEKNSDDVGGLLDDSFNDVSHDYENIDSDDEDIVLSELVKRSRDSSAPKEQVTRDRGHNKQGFSRSSTRDTRKIDKSPAPTRDQGNCESEVTDNGKSQRVKRTQVDLPRNINVDDSNPTVEVTHDKNTDEGVPKKPLRSISKSSKQKSKRNASAKQTTKKSTSCALKKPPVSHSMGRSQNNSKFDDHGPETDKNTDFTTNARDEYDEDVSKAKCRNKELIFSFDLQTLELLWNFKGK